MVKREWKMEGEWTVECGVCVCVCLRVCGGSRLSGVSGKLKEHLISLYFDSQRNS